MKPNGYDDTLEQLKNEHLENTAIKRWHNSAARYSTIDDFPATKRK